MKFLDLAVSSVVEKSYAATIEDEHVVAWNLHHEEQVGPSRQDLYEKIITGANDLSTLNAHHSSHVKQNVNVDRNSISECFGSVSANSQFGALEENQWLIRIERLNRAFDCASMLTDYSSLEEALNLASLGDPVAEAAVERFMTEWNTQRDGRPQFAAFKDEVVDEYDSTEWPDKLRDRLGLGHFNPRGSSAIEVAVMVYKAGDAIRRSKKLGAGCAATFSRPTVLDADLNTFFFPIPGGASYGATLHLGKGKAAILTQELLHVSFDYKRENLKKIGRINKPYDIGSLISFARNTHLEALQANGHGADWHKHP